MYMQSHHAHTHAASKVYQETDPHGKQSAMQQLMIIFLFKALMFY